MQKSVFIGIDLGGTHLRTALVNRSGKILESRKTKIRIDLGVEAASGKVAAQCLSLTRWAAQNGCRVEAIGLAVAGKIDKTDGRVLFSPNLPALNGYPLGRELEQTTGIPVFMENDANAYGLGECWAGAGRGMHSLVGIILGTGVGGFLFLNGKLWEGEGLGFSGEIGHMIVEPGGPRCRCGSKGCLESFASAGGLVRRAEHLLLQGGPGAGPLHDLRKNGSLGAEALFERATRGDAPARELFEKMGWALGIALANLFTVLGVRHAMIGGGASNAWGQFIGPLRDSLSRNLSMLDPKSAVIVRSALGEAAPLLGAARLASRRPARLYKS